jgi:hypothetical protein
VTSIPVRVDQGDGPEDVVIGARAIIAWERRTKAKISDRAAGIDDLAFMAYSQLGYEERRPLKLTYDGWLVSLVDLDASPVPTSPDEDSDADPSPG